MDKLGITLLNQLLYTRAVCQNFYNRFLKFRKFWSISVTNHCSDRNVCHPFFIGSMMPPYLFFCPCQQPALSWIIRKAACDFSPFFSVLLLSFFPLIFIFSSAFLCIRRSMTRQYSKTKQLDLGFVNSSKIHLIISSSWKKSATCII